MTLDDLYEELDFAESVPDINKDAGTSCCVSVKHGKVVTDDDEFPPDDDDDSEDLVTTLALLEDCLCVLEEVIDPTARTISLKVMQRAEDAALQARAWLNQHEGEDR